MGIYKQRERKEKIKSGGKVPNKKKYDPDGIRAFEEATSNSANMKKSLEMMHELLPLHYQQMSLHASIRWRKYKELISNNFTPEQALEIVIRTNLFE